MLTVTGLTNAEYLISSVALSVDEYYAGVGESPGVWAGRWAEILGLSGVVEADELRALVDGRHPATGEELMAGSRPRSVRAFDLTLSAPKSVSLLWALGSEPVANVLAGAHREATEAALGFLEERAALARVQSQGVRRRVATEGWVVAGFMHRTSREGDPQLHSHCLVPNLVHRTIDGRHVAFDAGPLFEWARAAGSIYQNRLQRVLSRELGVAWGPDRNNTREIEGFTCAQLRAFSKRSAQIEAELEAKGAVYESPALRMQADDEASLATRTAKDHSLTPGLLAERWQREAEQVGLALGAELDRAVCQGDLRLEPPAWDEITAALVDPELGLCSRSARFTKADVVEHICAMSGGRLTTEEIPDLADRFVDSDLAARLTPDTETGRRRPPQWSTAAHRALEDRTVALMDTLAARPAPLISNTAAEAALGGALGLGEDQVAAVRMLAGEGASLRTVLSPAGYGKTTMLHAAAQAAAADGRPVLAVATTAKAVAELTGAGLDARTIARLRIDLTDGPLASGTVVVLDEISQSPTTEVEAVLAAVDACPGGSIWVLGDPRQSQPVGPGGAADHIEQLAAAGLIPSARLTMNRRQVDAADREALDVLRRGDPTSSQQLRAEQGWEHEHASPTETRVAMAQAIGDDIAEYGAEQVAALVVSHTDAEDLADRIRARLAETGTLAGPAMTGPGWISEREYRAGDRVLLHARLGPAGSRLVNGTTATVTRVESEGLTIHLDRSGETAVLPASFVAGSRKDGSPNLSHSWARTVDGAQGGTWEACHLLGSSALDAYRGYTGQSRSRQPTRTWNTTKITVVDHGGILADQRDPAEQVADALARQPDPSLAARSDPWTLDRQLRDRIAEHERVLAAHPADHQADLVAATHHLRRAEEWRANMDAIAAQSTRRLHDLGTLAGISRHGRAERQSLQDKLAADTERADAARDRHDQLVAHLEELRREQDAFEQFEITESWRHAELPRLRDRLDQHWAAVVAACVRADDPLAYGIDKLRHARTTVVADLRNLDAGFPADRSKEFNEARRQLPTVISAKHHAEQSLADGRSTLEEVGRRRWGRQDREAIARANAQVAVAEKRVEHALGAERDLRDHLASLSQHQENRRQAIADTAPQRKDLESTLAQVVTALEQTGPERARALAEDPPPYLVRLLGPAPSSPAGHAVWCHHALRIESFVDRNDGISPPSTLSVRETNRPRQEIAIADRLLETSDYVADPTEWARLAGQAAAHRKEAHRQMTSKRALDWRISPFPQAQQWSPGVENSAERRGPDLSL